MPLSARYLTNDKLTSSALFRVSCSLHLVRQNIFKDAVASPMTYASTAASPYDKSSVSINDSSMHADADTHDQARPAKTARQSTRVFARPDMSLPLPFLLPQLRILTGKLKLSQMMYDQIVAENLKAMLKIHTSPFVPDTLHRVIFHDLVILCPHAGISSPGSKVSVCAPIVTLRP